MFSISSFKDHGLVEGIVTIREASKTNEPGYYGWGDVYGDWTMETTLIEIRHAMIEQHGDPLVKGAVFYNVRTKNPVPLILENKVKIQDLYSSFSNNVAQVYIKFPAAPPPPPPPYVAKDDAEKQ